jgi:hypothetical protein
MDEPLHLVSELDSPKAETAQGTRDFEDLVHPEHAGLYGALCLITRDRGEA